MAGSEHIIRPGTERDPDCLALATKQGTAIPNRRALENPPVVLRAAIEMMATQHPDARLRSISSTYNCTGMVLASRRTTIDPKELDWILKEDGYVGRDRSEVEVGDIVVYRSQPDGEPRHVAFVVAKKINRATGEIELECLSKWGDGGEYFHSETYLPTVYGSHREFYSERKTA